MRFSRTLVAVTVTVLALQGVVLGEDDKRPDDPAKAAREAAWERVEKRLKEADKKLQEAAAKHAKGVGDFIKDAKGKTGGLADELLSLEGKWEYVTRSKEGYQEYLRERYEARVMKPAALQETLERATKAYLKEVDAIENELLVAVEADLADLPRGAIPGLTGAQPFAKQFRVTAERHDALMKKNLQETVGREAAVLVVGEIASRVAVRVATAAAARLGLSAAVLGGSLGASAATVGASLVFGIAADYLLDAVLEALGYDPAGEIADQMRDGLDKLSDSLLIAGEEQAKVMAGLRLRADKDPDPAVRRACCQAMREILGSGTMGLPVTLYAAGIERGMVWHAALERLVRGTSGFEDLLTRLEKEWASLRGRPAMEAKLKAAALLEDWTNPGAASVLRRLQGTPTERINAAKAAVLLFARPDADSLKSIRIGTPYFIGRVPTPGKEDR